MTRISDLSWLLMVVAAVAMAVACTPFEVPIPKMEPARLRLVPTCPLKDSYKDSHITTAVPETFTFHCTGSRDSRAYDRTKLRDIPPDSGLTSGLLDHP